MGITLRHLWELIETSITGRESFLSRSCGVLVMCARKRVPLKTGLMASGTQNGPFSEKGLFRPFLGPGLVSGLVVELRRQPRN